MGRRTHLGRALRRRYGRAKAGVRFVVSVTHAGVPHGRGTYYDRFADANRTAIELVRSGRKKKATVLVEWPGPPGYLPRAEKVAEYVVGPGGGVMSAFSPEAS